MCSSDLPAEAIQRLQAEVAGTLRHPEVREQLIAAGLGEFIGSSPAEATRFVQAETERWGKLIRAAGIRAE